MTHWKKPAYFGGFIYIILLSFLMTFTWYDFYTSKHHINRAGDANTDEILIFQKKPWFAWCCCAIIFFGFVSLIPYFFGIAKGIKWLLIPAIIFFTLYAISEFFLLSAMSKGYRDMRDIYPLTLQTVQPVSGLFGVACLIILFFTMPKYVEKQGAEEVAPQPDENNNNNNNPEENNNNNNPEENNKNKLNENIEIKPNENKENKPNENNRNKPNENKENKPNENNRNKPNENKENKPNENNKNKPNEKNDK